MHPMRYLGKKLSYKCNCMSYVIVSMFLSIQLNNKSRYYTNETVEIKINVIRVVEAWVNVCKLKVIIFNTVFR